jgi:pimeloyl-ACP methyl ester carboxylesterase
LTDAPSRSTLSPQIPILFVHGNGDTAALWHTTIWRFESSGYSRDRLFAIDFTYPQARADDAVPMEGRSGSNDQLRELTSFVDHVRNATGATKVAMVASSRGANAVRNYIRHGGGEGIVTHAVLCGGVNHGVYASPSFNPGSEFNGIGPFMRGLNAAYPDGTEVSPNVRWLTIRSDGFDKYAQADGRFVGEPGMATHLTFEAPALKGAINLVLPRADHRELAFGPAAFDAMYRFITGQPPAQVDVIAENPEVVLDGKVSGWLNGSPTNIPLEGAVITVYQVAADTGARMPVAPHRKVVGPDGAWGPLATHPVTTLEFIVEAAGYPVTHIYRSPFPRSSRYVHLRPQPQDSLSAAEAAAGSVVMISRPRGYFGVGRDRFEIDGKAPEGVTPGVPAISFARMQLPARPLRAVPTRFNDESITVVNWPAAGNRIVVAEFHY